LRSRALRASILKPFLQSQGLNVLPNLILTHGDADHVGGFEVVANYFAPKQIVTSVVPFRSPFYRKAMEAAPRRSIPVVQLAAGERVSDWTVLYPTAEDNLPQADDKALVLATTLKGTRVLLLGDLGPLGQKALVERRAGCSCRHRGESIPSQGEPLTEPLLEKIHPREIIVVDATYPVSARVRPPLRERLARRGVPVFFHERSGGDHD
jgi:competence protein ComEC